MHARMLIFFCCSVLRTAKSISSAFSEEDGQLERRFTATLGTKLPQENRPPGPLPLQQRGLTWGPGSEILEASRLCTRTTSYDQSCAPQQLRTILRNAPSTRRLHAAAPLNRSAVALTTRAPRGPGKLFLLPGRKNSLIVKMQDGRHSVAQPRLHRGQGDQSCGPRLLLGAYRGKRGPANHVLAHGRGLGV